MKLTDFLELCACLPELNPANYSQDDVEELNNAIIPVILTARRIIERNLIDLSTDY